MPRKNGSNANGASLEAQNAEQQRIAACLPSPPVLRGRGVGGEGVAMKRSRARSPEAIEFARIQAPTANEFASTVWQWVRNRRISNQKFRREVPIPPYTADFCCVELKLILEIDGVEHFTADGRQRDRVRDDFLERLGYRVVRIAGYDLLREPRMCLQKIEEEVKKRMRELENPSQNPSPPAPLPTSRSTHLTRCHRREGRLVERGIVVRPGCRGSGSGSRSSGSRLCCTQHDESFGVASRLAGASPTEQRIFRRSASC